MITDLLKKLISIPSDYPHEAQLGGFVAGMFLKRGYEVRVQKVEGERSNIIVEKGKGDRVILLYNHLDTVSAAPGWKKNPLKPVLRGDRLYGLGAFDMKGGMAVNIETFLNYEPKNIKLRILFCVDEENISRGGFLFAGSKFMKDAACVLSPEPSFNHGLQGIVTGRIGRAVIQIHIRQTPLHFYFYHPRDDAHIVASQIITGLQGLYSQQGDKKEFVFVRSISSQAIGMSTPASVSLELDASVLPPHTNEDLLEKVRAVVSQVTKGSRVKTEVAFKKRETPFLAGYEIPKNNIYLEAMKESVRTVTGKQAVPYFRSSVADENIFGAMGKTVLGVGPVGANAHSADEWVSVASLHQLHTVYSTFLRRFD